jgi:hypothetical protein
MVKTDTSTTYTDLIVMDRPAHGSREIITQNQIQEKNRGAEWLEPFSKSFFFAPGFPPLTFELSYSMSSSQYEASDEHFH